MQVEMYKSLGFMGYPDYMVSRSGKVLSKNYHRSGKEKVLKHSKNSFGYLRVCLSKNKKHKMFSIHRLVALAWLQNPNNLPQVNHKDENPSNNRVENLEWCDCQYNNTYGTRIEKIIKKKINGKTSKRVYQYTKDGIFVKEWESTRECQRQGYRHISEYCNGKIKTAYGFIWSYERLK